MKKRRRQRENTRIYFLNGHQTKVPFCFSFFPSRHQDLARTPPGIFISKKEVRKRNIYKISKISDNSLCWLIESHQNQLMAPSYWLKNFPNAPRFIVGLIDANLDHCIWLWNWGGGMATLIPCFYFFFHKTTCPIVRGWSCFYAIGVLTKGIRMKNVRKKVKAGKGGWKDF